MKYILALLVVVLLVLLIVFRAVHRVKPVTAEQFMEEYSREKVKDVRFGVNRLAQGFEQDIASSGAGWISMSPVVLWAACSRTGTPIDGAR